MQWTIVSIVVTLPVMKVWWNFNIGGNAIQGEFIGYLLEPFNDIFNIDKLELVWQPINYQQNWLL